MFPLRDDNPTELTPFVTLLFIGANVAVWLLVQGGGSGAAFIDSLCRFGSIPAEVTGAVGPGDTVGLGNSRCRIGGLSWETVLTSAFMHGSWGHLIGNMWFLWVFGNNIEDSMGPIRFVVFYLATAALAAGAHILSDPGSTVPTVGASGAISGVMGAYMVLYPRVRIHTLVIFIFFFKVFALEAWVMLGYWFLLQLVLGAATPSGGGGVAFWAHAGGFVAGVALIKLFERRPLVAAKRAHRKLTSEELRRIGRF